MFKRILPLALVLSVAACGSAGGEQKKDQTAVEGKNTDTPFTGLAQAQLESPKNEKLEAVVNVNQIEEGIKIKATVAGLKPNSVHAIHIHEKGKCEGPDFKTAGDHFDPKDHPHAGPEKDERHVGDLGNLKANQNGVAYKELLIEKDFFNDWESLVGKPVILHAGADDLKSQPGGDAGGRIACGIIQKLHHQ